LAAPLAQCDGVWQRSRFVTAASEVAMPIGALGYLVAFGDMNLLSAGVAVEVAGLLSAFTGLGGHVGSPSARRVSRLLGPFSSPFATPVQRRQTVLLILSWEVGAISGDGWPKRMR
jgi:hypothetical protein